MIYEIKANRTRIQNVRFEFSLNRVTCLLNERVEWEVIYITILRKMFYKIFHKMQARCFARG